jgi:hypothetical protein
MVGLNWAEALLMRELNPEVMEAKVPVMEAKVPVMEAKVPVKKVHSEKCDEY